MLTTKELEQIINEINIISEEEHPLCDTMKFRSKVIKLLHKFTY